MAGEQGGRGKSFTIWVFPPLLTQWNCCLEASMLLWTLLNFQFSGSETYPDIRVCVCVLISLEGWRFFLLLIHSFLTEISCVSIEKQTKILPGLLCENTVSPPKKQGLIVPFEAKKTDTYIIFLGICNSKILFHLTGALKKIILHIQAELEKYFYLQE